MAREFDEEIRRLIRGIKDDLADLLTATLAAESAPYSATVANSWERTPVDVTAKGFRVTVQSPFFWANILDKGRPSVSPLTAPTLIWFKNPLRDDPRLQGGYYRTLEEAQSRKLTAAEVQAGRDAGTIVFARVSGAVAPANFVPRARRLFRGEAIDILKGNVRASLLRQTRELSGEFRFQVTF